MTIEFTNTMRNLRTTLRSVTRHTPARSTSPRKLMRRLRTSRAKAEQFDSPSPESAHTRVAFIQEDARSSHSKVEIDSYHGELTAAQDAAEEKLRLRLKQKTTRSLAYSKKILTDSNNALTNINKELYKQLIIEERKVKVLRFDLVNLDRELKNTDCKLEVTEQKLNESDQKREAAENHAQAIELQTVELMDLAQQDFDELYDKLEHIKYVFLGQPTGNLDTINESDADGRYFYDNHYVQPIDMIELIAIDAIYTVDSDSDNQQQKLSVPGVICLRKRMRTI
ncbi:hypothetical protein BX661DRAFT_197722 [Kickxella alabastrina]|uniref:uncharacterized protein n=1 Tax=Kickxella alabastrina TaxID=61397 RepID=UPI0022210761|nr:uncharacterized protein BX661DRAFT_197722 [Kickxella alabastrina]KAI7830016.1 hypothetical protein BX661DRAFT_197722 [Kickxella alabastrina]